MDYSFVKEDMTRIAKCESCGLDADHVMVIMDKKVIGVFQICYGCSMLVDLGGKEHRFIPKKGAKKRNEKCTEKCYPRWLLPSDKE